jgi:AraC-like DNA-binding protein
LFSRLHHRQLRWLEVGAGVFAALVVVWIGSWSWPLAVSNLVTNGLLALEVAVLGIFGARQRNVFDAQPWLDDVQPDRSRSEPTVGLESVEVGVVTARAVDSHEAEAQDLFPKYAKATLPPDLAAAIEQRLARHVKVDRPYLDCDLTLGDLAAAVGATPHQLSQVLSTRLGLSFFEYVNRLRVEAVKATLTRTPSSARPLLEIALECGFGSKSAFNEAFRRATGVSPSAYRRKQTASGAGGPVGSDAQP